MSITVIYSDGTKEELEDFSEIAYIPGSGGYFIAHDKIIKSIIDDLDFFEITRRMTRNTYFLDWRK